MITAVSRLAAILALLFWSIAGFANERIVDFHAEIEVDSAGTLTVRETIVVIAEGEQIKRGIYRDFPTRYLRPWGRVVVPFSVLSVQRNGVTEPYRVEQKDEGMRVYIGRADRQIAPGEHEYVLSYRTSRQVGFFAAHDELYWNVTGNDWAFPIESASASIRLPLALSAANATIEAYTGFAGEQGSDFNASFDEGGVARFATSQPLLTGQGLTVVVGWPKGVVREPDASERRANWLADNPELRVGAWGVFVLFAYYLAIWFWRGRDPAPGTIIPRYAPPSGVSAADARYLSQMGFDQRVVAAGVIGLAVKGWLEIHESNGSFTLVGRAGREPPTNDEKALLDALALGEDGSLGISNVHASRFKEASARLKDELKREHLKRHFITNAPWTILGLAASAVLLAGAAFSGGAMAPQSAFLILWLTGWTFGVYALLGSALRSWGDVLRGRLAMVVPAVFLTLFSLPFVGAEIFVFGLLFAGAPALLLLLFLLVGINYGFYRWLKAPTRLGRPLYDQLGGFRTYLDLAEKDRLNLLNPPEETPALFERYLPYALALGVEQRWSERFSTVMAAAGMAGEHAPHWYHGDAWNPHALGSFSESLGSGFAGALASAASPPGSSSGGGGGGSSGGGGGGGGGGGW